jgi:hypothetical protein
MRLRPVAFRYKPEIDPTGLAQYGLIAEDTERGTRGSSGRWRSKSCRRISHPLPKSGSGSSGRPRRSRSSPTRLPHSCHTGHSREPRTARECRTDAGFMISQLLQAEGSSPSFRTNFPDTASHSVQAGSSRSARGTLRFCSGMPGFAPRRVTLDVTPDVFFLRHHVPREGGSDAGVLRGLPNGL